MVKNPPAVQETQVQSVGGEIPRRIWQLTPAFLPGEFHGQRSLVGLQAMGLQSDMTEVPEHPQWTNNPLIMSCSVAKKTKVNKDPQILL